MSVGGYKILSLKNNNFTINGAKVKIDGIYEALEAASHGKLLLISDFKLGGVEKNARACNFGLDGTAYVAEVGIDADAMKVLYVKIEDDNNVSFYDV